MKLSQIVVDVKAQEEGERHEHPYFDGVFVTVRSIHSQAYRQRQVQLLNRMPRRTRRAGDITQANLEVARHAMADLLVGWEGIEDESGQPVAFSLDTAREWAAKPEYRLFFDGVADLASRIGEAEAEAREESLGN